MNETMIIGICISDHGFGHATRTGAVLKELLKLGVKLRIVTSVPIAVLELEESDNVEYFPIQADSGLYQSDAITADLDRTVEEVEKFWSTMDSRVEEISKVLRGVSLIIFDIAAVAPLVAQVLRVRSIAITNFSFYCIFDAIRDVRAEFGKFADLNEKAYKHADLLIELPFPCPMPWAAERRCRVDWTGRSSSFSKEQVRDKLGFDPKKKYLLMSFGGFGLDIDQSGLSTVPNDWVFVTVDNRVTSKAQDWNEEQRHLVIYPNYYPLRYVDVMLAMDVLVIKMGYGTVSELITHSLPCLFVRRQHFYEEQFLIAGLKDSKIPCEEIAVQDLSSSSLFSAAQKVFEQERPPRREPVGNVQAARIIYDFATNTRADL